MSKALLIAACGCFIAGAAIAVLGIQEAVKTESSPPLVSYNQPVQIKPDYLACVDEVSAIKSQQQDRIFHLLESSRCMPTADLPEHDAEVITRQGSVLLVNVLMPDDESARLWVPTDSVQTKKPE